MRRNVTLEEISDGRLYGPNDMVKADAQGCAGCSKCCQSMGNSIILDPYDVFRLTTGLKCSMEELLEKYAQLNVVDGVILPNLRMTGKEERCPFLSVKERCSIHPLRPGVCRLFPLGRYYENGSFRYFLQTGECTAMRTKVKVSKWIDTPDGKRYQGFINTWHYLLKEIEELLWENEEDSLCRNLNLFLLNTFYFAPYALEDFYSQFEERLGRFRQVVPKREF